MFGGCMQEMIEQGTALFPGLSVLLRCVSAMPYLTDIVGKTSILDSLSAPWRECWSIS
jgi:hypothetical protein